MSTSELKRAGVLARVAAETLTLRSAAVLMELSDRQVKRLYGRYRAEGAKGLKDRSAGRGSNRAAPGRLRKRVLALIREKYSGGVDERFGPTLAAEHLASEDGVTVDHETLRRWMLAAGLWSRARKRSPHRRRRARMAHFGELVQLDGSFHPVVRRSGAAELFTDAGGRCDGPQPRPVWGAGDDQGRCRDPGRIGARATAGSARAAGAGRGAAASARCRSSVAPSGRAVPDRSATGRGSQGVRRGKSVRRPVEAAGAVDAKCTATTGIINKGTFLAS